MNIALLIDTLDGGGAEHVVCHLALGLARRGHGTFAYCLKSAGPSAAALRAADVTVRAARNGEWTPSLLWRIGRWMRADRIDVANAHSSAATLAALPAARLLNIPLIQTRHSAPQVGGTPYVRWATRASGWLDGVTIVAPALRSRLPWRLARRAVFIPNGADRPTTSPEQARQRLEKLCRCAFRGPVVLNIANLRPPKDAGCLLRAFDRLRHRCPGATLVWIGATVDAAYREQVEGERRRLRLEDCTHFSGHVVRAGELIAGADVLCLSSRSEAMPLVVLEAMSLNVPVVATAVGGVGLLAEDARPDEFLLRHGRTALLVPPEDPEALAAALVQTLGDPAAAAERAARAAEDFERFFTSDRMIARYEELYRAYTTRRRPPQRTRCARRHGVLMLGPAPPQVGGMVTSIGLLMRSPLRQQYDLLRRGTTRRIGTESCFRALNRHLADLVGLGRTLLTHRVGMLHIHTCSFFTFYRNLLDAAVAKLLRRKVILHIRGNRFDDFCAGAGRIRRWLIRRGLEQADAVILLSRSWHQALRPYLGNARVFVVPNAFDPDMPTASRTALRPPRPCRFLFLAAVTERKGVGDLLDAARLLRCDGTPFELVIAGPARPAEFARWLQRIRETGLDDCVRLARPVTGSAKADLLRWADCFVHPSHSEGLPNSVLEAGAVGLPIISTAVGAVPEVFAPFARETADGSRPHIPLVPPQSPEALAREMKRYALDPELRRAAGTALREHIRANYSVHRLAQRIGNVYRQVLAAGRPRSHWLFAPPAWIARHVTFPLYERLRGRPTIRELRALRRASTSSRPEVEADQARRLRSLLRFAADNLPYYRQRFAEVQLDPDADNPHAQLAKLPVLRKTDVRANATDMTWPDVPGGLLPCSSGGTSGDTLHFHVDCVRQAQPMAARLFMQSRFGVQPGDRRAHLWGSRIEVRSSWLAAARDRLINELLLDAYDLSPAQMDAYLVRLRDFRPRVLYGYPSAVERLAQHVRRQAQAADLASLKLVVLTGEESLPQQRAQIRETFGCAVASEYGSREVGLIAHECPRGGLHVIAPHLLVEVLRQGRPAAPDESGEIVCTTLNARAQPLIRYALGDIGALRSDPCPCGLALPLLRLDGGRSSGLLTLPDGRVCSGSVSSCVLRDEPGIVQFRTYQRARDRLEILLVVDEDFRAETVTRIRQRYARLFGSHVQVDCQIVDRIPPDPSGKRRHVISEVAPAW